MTTDNDAKFALYAALDAKIKARLANPTPNWTDRIDDAPIRTTAKIRLDTPSRG